MVINDYDKHKKKEDEKQQKIIKDEKEQTHLFEEDIEDDRK